MDKISLDFFDFFGAALPAIPSFIISCFIITNAPFSFIAISELLMHASLYQVTAVAIACYAIGFCFHYPAYELFKPLVELWGVKRTKGLPISIGKRETELVKIRHKSPENFRLISKFMALRQMAYTMFFSLIIFTIGVLLISIFHGSWNRDVFAAIFFGVIFAFLFLRRAVAFHQRIQEMITEASAIP